jgi:DNA mismatch endonuclease (patch repair protein)
MADVFSKKKRSTVMAAVKSRGTRTTELALRQLLRRNHISGWRTNAVWLPGSPDFVFLKFKLAIFVDGCFWHGCRKCSRPLVPTSNIAFWKEKIESNRRRDVRVVRQLRRLGWATARFWEHDIKKAPAKVVRRIVTAIRNVKGSVSQ